MLSTVKWLLDAIPRSPKRAGLLMRLYYRWQENFTAAGHAAAALLPFSMFAGMVPGFWAAWIFGGLDFLFFLTLVPSLFLTAKKNRLVMGEIVVPPVYEKKHVVLSVQVTALNRIDSVSVYCSRMHPSIKCIGQEPRSVAAGESVRLECELLVGGRGVYSVPKVSLAVPEIKGMLRALVASAPAELVVYPEPVRVKSFGFLTAGGSGMAFAPLLMPNLFRGMEFAGVREYREGDSLRDLHHKAFARYGRPFTKEFETERGSGCVLVLDVRASGLREKSLVEPLIRLAAGVGIWLIERGALGRFFVGDDEIPETHDVDSFLEALARIPHKVKSQKLWSPSARPTGPVLRLGLRPVADPLVHKQVVVTARAEANAHADETYFVNLGGNPTEVSL